MNVSFVMVGLGGLSARFFFHDFAYSLLYLVYDELSYTVLRKYFVEEKSVWEIERELYVGRGKIKSTITKFKEKLGREENILLVLKILEGIDKEKIMVVRRDEKTYRCTICGKKIKRLLSPPEYRLPLAKTQKELKDVITFSQQ